MPRGVPAKRDEHGKTCPRCGEHKPWSAYAKNSSTRDGCQAYCRACSVQLQKESDEKHALAIRARFAEKLSREADSYRTKTCRKCGNDKPELEFYAHRSTADGRANYCRDCARQYQREWRERHPTKTAEYNKIRDLDPQRRRKHEMNKRSRHLRMYGLTPESYDALLASQGDACAICGEPGQTWADRNLHVDHDHETNEVRGLLCGRCNLGLSYFKDDFKRLARAISYLADPPMTEISGEVRDAR